jgi:hypothetical protein
MSYPPSEELNAPTPYKEAKASLAPLFNKSSSVDRQGGDLFVSIADGARPNFVAQWVKYLCKALDLPTNLSHICNVRVRKGGTVGDGNRRRTHVDATPGYTVVIPLGAPIRAPVLCYPVYICMYTCLLE